MNKGVCRGQYQTSSSASTPSDQGFNPEGFDEHPLPRKIDLAVETFNIETGEVEARLDEVDAQLIALVKQDASALKMKIYTPLPGKEAEYEAKKREVIDFRAVGDEQDYEALDAENKDRRFVYAIADAAAYGDSVADAIERFEGGIASTEGRVASLAATEHATCSQIKAAGTAEAKQAIYEGIQWPI